MKPMEGSIVHVILEAQELVVKAKESSYKEETSWCTT
jgi:hypothetical protein